MVYRGGMAEFVAQLPSVPRVGSSNPDIYIKKGEHGSNLKRLFHSSLNLILIKKYIYTICYKVKHCL
jgi:hypothetical protein